MSRNSVPFHPLIFAIYPVVFLYTLNRQWFDDLTSYAMPLVISTGLLAVVFLVLLVLFRNLHKAGLLTSLFLFLFFSFEMLYFKKLDFVLFTIIFKEKDFVRLLAVVFIVLVVLTWRSKKLDFIKITSILNVTGLALLAMPLLQMAVQPTHEFTEPEPSSQVESVGDHWGEPADEPRDIYYIILDGYAHKDSLRDVYGYDNSEFYSYLDQKGFYVASESLCNYPRTRLSLPSSLNMTYLPEDFVLDGPIEPMTALRYLQSRGYLLANFNSGWGGTTNLPFADVNVTYNYLIPNNEVMTLFLGMTAARPFAIGKGFTREQVLFVFNNMPRVVKELKSSSGGRPVAVLAHIICPHPPFVFSRNGGQVEEAVARFDGDVWALKEAYVDQLVFTNTQVRRLVESLVAQSTRKPIIILQADHGTFGSRHKGIDWDEMEVVTLKERTRIFNAYLWPEIDQNKVLYSNITPVNSFRLLLNTYFDEHLNLLPDTSYIPLGNDGYFRFIDVTEEVDFH